MRFKAGDAVFLVDVLHDEDGRATGTEVVSRRVVAARTVRKVYVFRSGVPHPRTGEVGRWCWHVFRPDAYAAWLAEQPDGVLPRGYDLDRTEEHYWLDLDSGETVADTPPGSALEQARLAQRRAHLTRTEAEGRR